MDVQYLICVVATILMSNAFINCKRNTHSGGRHIVTPDNGKTDNQNNVIDHLKSPSQSPIISSTPAVPSVSIFSTSSTTSTSATSPSITPSNASVKQETSTKSNVITNNDTIIAEAASTNQPSTENIDLSDLNRDTFGQTPTSMPFSNKERDVITRQKCNEYYGIGKRNKRSEIKVFLIGGTTSKQKEFPHMAALGYGNKRSPTFLCGGSLISENFVITAGHCLTAKNTGDVQYVRLGTTVLHTETLNSIDYKVIKRIPHPNYIIGEYYNDIALLQLEQKVSFNEYIAPICLYSGDTSNELTHNVLTTLGWGRTASNGDVSAELQKIDISFVPHNICQRMYSNISEDILPNGIISETQLCAGTEDGSKDACQGDSGGPIEVQIEGRMYLVGITSFGIGCGRPGSAGVYTKVSPYVPWIEQNVWIQ